MLRNKKILILGGSGFIGKNLLSQLTKLENSVTVMTRRHFFTKAKLVFGDLTKNDYQLRKIFINFDIIFNCAGEIKNKKKMDLIYNVSIKKIIKYLSLQCLKRKKKVRWIELSSIGVYGFNDIGKKKFLDEKSKTNPSNYYEKSKLESEKIITQAANNFFEYIILRPSTVYGKGMKSDFIQKLNFFIKKKYFFYINSKETIFNMIHINDLSNALILCGTTNNTNEIYNVTKNYKLSQIVKIICDFNKISEPKLVINEKLIRFLVYVLNKFININLNSRIINILVSKKYFSENKINNLLGFKTKMKLDNALPLLLKK